MSIKEIRDELAGIYRRFFPKKIVLGRTACLGLDIFKYKNRKRKDICIVNQQKARIDLLLEWLAGVKRPKASLIEKHMARKDVFIMIQQQERLPWLDADRKIEYMIMDSFSELTDQRFVHKKEGWAFACHYSDIEHTPDFEADFECKGLLDLKGLEVLYNNFFDWFQDTYPGRKIYYFHFPTKTEKRQEFRQRAKKILDIMEGISKRKDIVNIEIDEKYVIPSETDNFPYHYGSTTYEKFVEKLNDLEKLK